MADESQMRIEALKKVYAEIILNTSKEAASRVMAAERKALCFHHDLVSLKEESLRMFLRLKNNFDFKSMEAEARSVNQQQKIDELEAQLSEAEGIIIDLRDEMKQVHEKLEITRHNQNRALSGHILRVDEPAHEHMRQDNPHNSSPLVVASVSGEEYCTNMVNLSRKLHLDQLRVGKCDFASIIIEGNETELYRNGCTQRIRAFDNSLSTMNFPSPSEDHQPMIHVQSETDKDHLANVQNRERKRGQFSEESNRNCPKMLKTSNEEFNVNFISDKEPFSMHSSETDKKDVRKIPYDYSSDKDRAIRSLRTSARKDSRYREAIAALRRSSRKNCKKSYQESLPAQQRTPSSDVKLQSFENPMERAEKGSKDTEFWWPSSSDELGTSIEIKALSEKLCPVSVDVELMDVPASKGSDDTQTQNKCEARKDRHLKFTFQRKRGKNVLGKLDQNIGLDRCTGVQKTTGAPLAESSSLKDELNGDGGVMQVDHQLASLSGEGS